MTVLVFRSDPYLQDAPARVIGHTAEGAILIDRSIFYPQGGGQPGDSGWITWAGARIPVATTIKAEGGLIGLVPAEPLPLPGMGADIRLVLDWTRRHRHMRMHTALHLLSVVIPLPVSGGQIGSERSRLDFDMPDPPGDVEGLAEAINILIDRDLAVREDWISEAELAASPDLVKTMSVRPPAGQGKVRLIRIGQGPGQVDLQPCGGTHVARTGEVGRVEIGKIEKKGRQNRRVSITLSD
jgi:misacylated tRNA(Ala) deacylase